MSLPIPFSPASSSTAGKTVKVTANADGSTNATGTIAAAASASTIIVTNTGSAVVFVRISAEATPVAAATDYPMLPGSQVALSNPAAGAAVGLSVLLAAAGTAADIYFTPGEGQ